MFFEEGMTVCAITDDDKTYKGIVYRIVIQPCEDDHNRPHALIFISQEKEDKGQNEEFGCIALWVDKLKQIDVV